MTEIIAFVARPFSAALGWLHTGLDALGAKPVIVAVIGMALMIRFLLKPFMGGGSDKAKEREE